MWEHDALTHFVYLSQALLFVSVSPNWLYKLINHCLYRWVMMKFTFLHKGILSRKMLFCLCGMTSWRCFLSLMERRAADISLRYYPSLFWKQSELIQKAFSRGNWDTTFDRNYKSLDISCLTAEIQRKGNRIFSEDSWHNWCWWFFCWCIYLSCGQGHFHIWCTLSPSLSLSHTHTHTH